MADSLMSEIYGWPAPNYTNPVTRGPGLVVAGAVLGTLGTLLVALRIYTRLRITSSFGGDDVLIMVAAVCSCLPQLKEKDWSGAMRIIPHVLFTWKISSSTDLRVIGSIIVVDGDKRHCIFKIWMESACLGHSV